MAINTDLRFFARNTKETICIFFPIIDDLIFEKDEEFTVHIASEPGIIIYDPYSTVTIIDNEGNLCYRAILSEGISKVNARQEVVIPMCHFYMGFDW